MGIGGGIIGGIIGGCFGGSLGALIGAGIGFALTGTGSSKRTQHTIAADTDEEDISGLLAVFGVLAKIAKADGAVSQEEADFISSLLRRLPASREDKHALRDCFNKAKNDSLSARDYLNGIDPRGVSEPDTILGLFCSLAAVDKHVSPAELNILYVAESHFGCPGFVNTFFAKNTSSSSSGNSNRNSNRKSSSAPAGNDPYAILGCPRTASNVELKKAYRAKCLEFHPDKIQAKGLSAAFIDFAKKEMQQINEAWAKICAERGIS